MDDNKVDKEFIKKIIDKLEKIDYIEPEKIPNIGLYMDQVTTFMDEHLKSLKRFEDDKMLTKTMINNYTKNNLLPSPEKKKYSKEHIVLLVYIYYFKNVLSMSDIQKILNPFTDMFYQNVDSDIDMLKVYKEIFEHERGLSNEFTKDLTKRYVRATKTFENMDVEDDEQKEFLTMFSFISDLCFDVYIKKTIVERLLDAGVLKNFDKDK